MTEWGIGALFDPGRRHLEEEKKRLQSTREDIGDSSGGRRIDLDSGTVVIRGKSKAPDPESAEADTESEALDQVPEEAPDD
jgi:hypothetical protein